MIELFCASYTKEGPVWFELLVCKNIKLSRVSVLSFGVTSQSEGEPHLAH
jgi:hypothetical protein